MRSDRGVLLKQSDTAYASATNYHDRLQHLRRYHHYVPPETARGTQVDDKLPATDRKRNLRYILSKAKPMLSNRVSFFLDKIKHYLAEGENKPLKDEYKYLNEEVLGILSPEVLAAYRGYAIEFVVNEDVSYPTARKKGDKWQLNVPTKYAYPVGGIILRYCDEILKVEFEYAKEIAQGSAKAVEFAAKAFMMSRRAEMAARVFLMNMQLGEKYGWDIKGYELAEKYHQDYNDGICKAFGDGFINVHTSQDKLVQIGSNYAYTMLLERIVPAKGVPRVFPSMQPAAYFEEFTIKERTIRRKQSMITYRAEEPMKLGTDEYEASIKGEEKQQLNVVVLPNKEIWVLPATFVEGQKSQHSIIAKGNPCVWTGEVEIEGRKVTRMKDQSGHFKTYHYRDAIQKAIEDFALQAFRQQGYEVPEAIERTGKGRG